MRKLAPALLATLLLAIACGSGGGRGTNIRHVVNALGRSDNRSHSFTYFDETLDGKTRITVEGRVEDDFRYAGTVSLNGTPMFEAIVSDDAVAVRLLNVGAFGQVVEEARAGDAPTAQALADGRWVIDHTAAPEPSGAASSEGGDEESASDTSDSADETQIGNDPFFDAADAIRYSQDAFRGSIAVQPFNPEDIDYNPADDPWASDVDRDLDAEGVRRFDLVQPPLPPRPSRGDTARPPGVASFRKMIVYLKGERAQEVREQISIRDRVEFRRAEQGRTARYYLELRDAALNGGTLEPMRERRMNLELKPYKGGSIELPTDAQDGFLTEVLGSTGLRSVFGFKYIGGGAQVLASPAPTALSTPSASQTPASAATTPAGSPSTTGSPSVTATPATQTTGP